MTTISMYDQRVFTLACGHVVVIGRLENVETWTCEQCGKVTDLSLPPYQEQLARELDTTDQIDKQARQRGETVVRESRGGT